MDIRHALGNRIRMLRELRGLKQYELADLIERSIDGLSLIERGENWPSAETVERLSHAFGVPATDLFDGLQIEGGPRSPNYMARARATLARLPSDRLILAAELLETLERNLNNRH